jgi:hypothetical protein
MARWDSEKKVYYTPMSLSPKDLQRYQRLPSDEFHRNSRSMKT